MDANKHDERYRALLHFPTCKVDCCVMSVVSCVMHLHRDVAKVFRTGNQHAANFQAIRFFYLESCAQATHPSCLSVVAWSRPTYYPDGCVDMMFRTKVDAWLSDACCSSNKAHCWSQQAPNEHRRSQCQGSVSRHASYMIHCLYYAYTADAVFA